MAEAVDESDSEAAAIDDGGVDDVESCIALWLRALTDRDGVPPIDGTAERCRAKFALPRVSWRVLRSPNGRVHGFGLLTAPGTGAPADPPTAAYLALLAVDPSAQGKGKGARLLAALTADARAAGHGAAVLHVLADNPAATGLYRSVGWRPLGDVFAHPLSGKPTQTYLLDLLPAVAG